MFGRPLAIASHHFNTQLPHASDPILYPSEPRIYLPNIALFRLAYILGDIMDSAVSLRTVPYEVVQANDRSLTQWMESLPGELDLDEFRVARSLASPDVTVRRLGVQSVIIRTSYYHIRFTLHRPYASAPSGGLKPPKDGGKEESSPGSSTIGTFKDARDLKAANSLDIAVGSADKLITLVGQARPDFLANASLAVPGHMNWGPFHVFSASMFFSFQLIANPDQPGASLFRANIQKALSTLELSRGAPVADKALDILYALAPLYSQDFANEDDAERERKKERVLSLVKTLAFPYHDSPKYLRTGAIESPNTAGSGSSPGTGHSGSPQGLQRASDYSMGVGIGSARPSSSLVGYATSSSTQIPALASPPVPYGVPTQLYSDPSRPVHPQSHASVDHSGTTTTSAVCHTSGSATAGAGPSVSTVSVAVSAAGGSSTLTYADARAAATTGTSGGYTDTYTGQRAPPQSYNSSTRHYSDPARQPYADSSRQPYVAGGDPAHHPVHGGGGRGSYATGYGTGSGGTATGAGAGGTGTGVYHPVESETMWGASVSQAEWVNFLNAMQRPPGGR